MAKFDVYRLPAKGAPLVVDIQSDFLESLATRLVIPLVPHDLAEEEAAPGLKPVLRIEGRDFVLMTTDIAALPVRRLGDFVMNVEADYRTEITEALDFLFLGF